MVLMYYLNMATSSFKTIFLFLIFLILINISSFCINIDSILTETVNNYKNIKTIQSDIIDKYSGPKGQEKYSGNYFSNGEFTKINFNKPYKQQILITKDSILWYFPDDSKIYIGLKTQKPDIKALQMENNVSKEFLNSDNYKIEKTIEKKLFSSRIKVVATPKVKRTSKFSGIIIYIDPKRSVITDAEYYDLAGNEIIEQHFRKFKNFNNIWLSTHITSNIFSSIGDIKTDIIYKNTFINQNISDDNFILKYPKGITTFKLF